MSMNQSEIHDMYRKYLKIFEDLIMEDAMDQTALKYRNFYVDLGMIYTRFVTPYLWVFPLTAVLLLSITFKRQNLVRPTQKCLLIVTAIDVLCVMFISVKDIVFNLKNWNYGIIEYKVCMFMLLFLRIQTIIHGTSLWIKSLTLIQRVLLFLCPFKFKHFNLKLVLVPCCLYHLVVAVMYCSLMVSMPIAKVPPCKSSNQEYLGQRLTHVYSKTMNNLSMEFTTVTINGLVL